MATLFLSIMTFFTLPEKALRLLAALLRAEPEPAPALDGDEWEQFADLVSGRHRVAPAVVGAIAATGMAPPGPVAARLEAETRANAFAALAYKAETARLISALANRSCHPVMMKGWPLAEELLGAAAARHSKDIDLYIAVNDLLWTLTLSTRPWLRRLAANSWSSRTTGGSTMPIACPQVRRLPHKTRELRV